ncbi:hypothetical protein OG889_32610 [Streptomyces sp. NBC_00481]|uniref:hypothetical protein n=1 Tax=Streptomyces sp. NBC_00481 TaxID=2975755 RepID=UPI002DDA311D|nr:hypothetical protein [Streptomyces sp. NBC_00481]WRY99018.1 hypothetical protein OG889_32610 [Streptomyces sp. NBC_00481]
MTDPAATRRRGRAGARVRIAATALPAAARELGMSLRTHRRRVAELLDTLDGVAVPGRGARG